MLAEAPRRAKFPSRGVQDKGTIGLGQCLFGVLFRGTCEGKLQRKFLRRVCPWGGAQSEKTPIPPEERPSDPRCSRATQESP